MQPYILAINIQLLNDENKRTTLSNNIKAFAIEDAAERIVDEVFKLIPGVN